MSNSQTKILSFGTFCRSLRGKTSNFDEQTPKSLDNYRPEIGHSLNSYDPLSGRFCIAPKVISISLFSRL